MKKIIVYIGIFVVTATLSLNIQAQNRAHRAHQKCMQDCSNAQMMKQDMEPGQQGMHMLMNLPGITEEQIGDIRALHLEHQKKVLPLHNQLREKQAKYRTLVTSAEYDQKAVFNLIDEMAELKTEIAKDRAATHQEVRKVLNEEQRILFDNRMTGQHRMRSPGKTPGPGKRGGQ